MKEKEINNEIEEAFKHPKDWNKMTSKEKDMWAFQQTMRIGELSTMQINNAVKKRSLWVKHQRGVLAVLLGVNLLLTVWGIYSIWLSLAISMIILPLIFRQWLRNMYLIKTTNDLRIKKNLYKGRYEKIKNKINKNN